MKGKCGEDFYLCQSCDYSRAQLFTFSVSAVAGQHSGAVCLSWPSINSHDYLLLFFSLHA